MFFYDANYTLVKVPITHKISHRYNTHHTYKTADGKCLKRFRVISKPSLELEKKIQELSLDNFYKIEQFLFNKSGNFRGVIMPYYESSEDDILLKPSDYLSDNFNSIFQSFLKLADAKIETQDANLENTIFTQNEIIIIDSERYREYEDEEHDLPNENYHSAAWILYSALINASKKHQEFNGINFYNWFYQTEPDGFEVIKELSKYSTPIEYLHQVKQKIKQK